MTIPNEVDDPGRFLHRLREAEAGWSAEHGGPAGIALLTLRLQDRLKVQAQELAAVRAAAIAELLKTQSLADVARQLGVSKQAISKAANGPRWGDPKW